MSYQSEVTFIGRVRAALRVVRGLDTSRPRLPDVVIARDELARMSRGDIQGRLGFTFTDNASQYYCDAIEGSGY